MSREKLSDRLRFEVLKRDGFKCSYCGVPAITTELVIDHIKPVADGGLTEYDNLTAACVNCNSGKRDVPLTERRPPKPDQRAGYKREDGVRRGYCLCRRPHWRWSNDCDWQSSYTRSSFTIQECTVCGSSTILAGDADGKERTIYVDSGVALVTSRAVREIGTPEPSVWDYISDHHSGGFSEEMIGIDVKIYGTQFIGSLSHEKQAARWRVSVETVAEFWHRFYWLDYDRSEPAQ
jgi:hypothetical protein